MNNNDLTNMPIPDVGGMNNGIFRDAEVGDVKAEVPIKAATAEGNNIGNGDKKSSFLSGNVININFPAKNNTSSTNNRYATETSLSDNCNNSKNLEKDSEMGLG